VTKNARVLCLLVGDLKQLTLVLAVDGTLQLDDVKPSVVLRALLSYSNDLGCSTLYMSFI